MAGGNESSVCLPELKESGCTTFAIIRSLRYNTIYTRREI